jgi:hypothetical protein
VKVTIDGQVYAFDRSQMRNRQYMEIERVTGMTTGEWEQACERGSVLAMTALVWFVLRFNGQEDLAFEDVDFDPVKLEVDADEEPGKDPEPEAPSPPS